MIEVEIRLKRLTDGTSNTMALSECAFGMLSQADQNCWHWWASGNYADTIFSTLYPINPFRKINMGDSNPGINADLGPSTPSSFPQAALLRVLRRLGEVHQGLGPVPTVQPDDRSSPGLRLQRRPLVPDLAERRLPGPLHPQWRRGHQLRPVLKLIERPSRSGHVVAHHAYSRREWVNRLAAMGIDITGVSRHYWHWNHNIFHHTYPNVDGEDTDIAVSFLARHLDVWPRDDAGAESGRRLWMPSLMRSCRRGDHLDPVAVDAAW